MKKALIHVLFLLPTIAAAQKGYTINGKLSGLKEPAKVYLATMQNGAFKDTDSTEIKKGKFTFKGSLNEPALVILRVNNIESGKPGRQRDMVSMFLENSKITIRAKDSIKNAAIKGSLVQNENKELEAAIRPLTNTIIKLQKEFSGKPKDEAYKKAGDSVTYLVSEIKNIRRKFVESHPDSYAALYAYHHFILDSKFDPATVEPLFNQFTSGLRSTELGKRTAEKIEIGKRRQTGIMVTNFTQNDLNDKPFTLSSLRGKYVLVDFWASWCVPCRAENPNVVKAYAELKDKNFEIVGVSLDQGKEAWEAAVKKDGLPWIHVSDLKGWKNEVAMLYGVNSVPQNLLIDPQGMIIGKNLRGEALTEKLKELIK